MIRLITLILLTGCVVYSNKPPANSPPWFEYADGGCFWDGAYEDYVWYFDVDVNDDLGPGDVMYVWADVYDTRSGLLEDSFELAPEPGRSWYSAWLGSSTWLDPAWPWYEIVISAEDSEGAVGSVSLYAEPCW